MATAFSEIRIRKYPRREVVYSGRYVFNWFSNFTASGFPVVYRGYTTNRLEIAYVAAKNPEAIVPTGIYPPDGTTMRFIDRIFTTPAASKAKWLGKSKSRGGLVDARGDWEFVKLAAMDNFLRQRWQPGSEAFIRLLTEETPIVEFNNWGDTVWGAVVGKWSGQNAFGILLDLIVAEYRESGKVSPGAEEQYWERRQDELILTMNNLP